jgi:hypothetical protein
MHYARYLDSFNLIYTAESEYSKYSSIVVGGPRYVSFLRPLFASPIHTYTVVTPVTQTTQQ